MENFFFGKVAELPGRVPPRYDHGRAAWPDHLAMCLAFPLHPLAFFKRTHPPPDGLIGTCLMILEGVSSLTSAISRSGVPSFELGSIVQLRGTNVTRLFFKRKTNKARMRARLWPDGFCHNARAQLCAFSLLSVLTDQSEQDTGLMIRKQPVEFRSFRLSDLLGDGKSYLSDI